MIESMFVWTGAGNYSFTEKVENLYGNNNISYVVVDCLIMKDYLEALQLIHGKELTVVTLWDWADTMWDKLTSKTSSMQDEIFLVASNRMDLCQIWDKHGLIQSIKTKAVYRHRMGYQPQLETNYDYRKGFIY